MSQPLISIILPVFNSANTIQATLDSILVQDYGKREIIVVDGLSTDGSIEILRRYESELSSVIIERDKGVFDAVNKGIIQSRGEWIYIIGADDYLASSDVLSKLVAGLDATAQLIIGNVDYIGTKHALVPRRHVSSWSGMIRMRNTLHQQGALYHRSLFDSFRFNTAYAVLADYDFHLYLYAKDIRVQRVEITIACCAAQGLSKQFGSKLYREEFAIKRQRLPLIYLLLNVPWIMLKYLIKGST